MDSTGNCSTSATGGEPLAQPPDTAHTQASSALDGTPSIRYLSEHGMHIPDDQKERILILYGSWTFDDFDGYGFNMGMGATYPTCFQTMMYYMNETEGDLSDQFNKLAWLPEPTHTLYCDMFNIVQSAVRSRIGERVWYP